jgi:hypothetical protein
LKWVLPLHKGFCKSLPWLTEWVKYPWFWNILVSHKARMASLCMKICVFLASQITALRQQVWHSTSMGVHTMLYDLPLIQLKSCSSE